MSRYNCAKLGYKFRRKIIGQYLRMCPNPDDPIIITRKELEEFMSVVVKDFYQHLIKQTKE